MRQMPHATSIFATNRNHSTRFFACASYTFCHCMLSGRSKPPRCNDWMLSITQPGQGPETESVDGQGLAIRKSRRAEELRLIRPPVVRSHEAHQVERCFVSASRLKHSAIAAQRESRFRMTLFIRWVSGTCESTIRQME